MDIDKGLTPPKILIADDDYLIRESVLNVLEMFGYDVCAVSDGKQVLAELSKKIDVIILDINMPGMDGFETISAINKRKLDIPVLFLTGAGTMDNAVKAINLGAYDFITKPIKDLDIFEVKIKRAVEKRMYLLKDRAYKIELEKEVRSKTRELKEKNELLNEYSRHLEISTLNTILTLQTALEEKDQYTAGHTTRVTQYALMIGEGLGLPNEDMVVLERACKLHDIGKLVIDISCIQKPGPLTAEEWILVKKHPEIGENIITPLSFLDRERSIIRQHHERIDGKGYPDGLKGENLGILTKIITVADSYDAMTSKRSYKVNMSKAQSVAELRNCSGTQFDPDIVEMFIWVLQKSEPYAKEMMVHEGRLAALH